MIRTSERRDDQFHDDGSSGLPRTEVPLAELWATAWALGRVAEPVGYAGGGLLLTSPVARAALATMPAGALRRVVPEHRLAEVAAALEPLIHAGIRAGALRRAKVRA